MSAKRSVRGSAPGERSSLRSPAQTLGPWLDRLTAALGASFDAPARAQVETWLDKLDEWNARIDLTAARSPEMLVDLMLADALVLAARIERGVRVVDVGAGAGAPGLALALARPDLRVTLVEPLGKRASFLRAVTGAVGRTDIAIERVRAEALRGPPAWDVALSRATFAPARWLEVGAGLVAPGGAVWVLLAKEDPPSHAHATLEEVVTYCWPLGGAERRAVRYRSSRGV